MNIQPAFLKSVLLVDDDKVTNLMHARLIRRSGLVNSIEVATDGIAALQNLEERRVKGTPMPELILLDINMPRMDGFEFLERYGRDAAHVESTQTLIIMLSTSILHADQARAEADPNVHKFVSKPITISQIQSLVAAHHVHFAPDA